MKTGLQFRGFLRSSIVRKQIVALTGLALLGFLIAHLSGNVLIYAGPEVFNAYSKKVASFGPLLWMMRLGLIAAFVVHVWLTVTLVRENRAARPNSYEVNAPKGRRSFATTTMIYTGIFVAAFLVLHLYDFTFGTKSGPQSVVPAIEADVSQGLFGLVWNSFRSAPWGPVRTTVYVLAMAGVGLHLSHAIQSVFQTFGFNHERYTPVVRTGSIIVGGGIALAFALIPIYIMLAPRPLGI